MRELVLDIWHGNRGIDLATWKARHGLWGVIIKAGGSDDRTWGRYEESTLRQQYDLARSLGLHVGTYYYSKATTPAEAKGDAEHYLAAIAGLALDLPCYMDVEEPAQLALSMTQLTDTVCAFCDVVNDGGYMAGIYSGYDGYANMHELQYSKYALWVASWRSSWPVWAQHFGMWQQGSMCLDNGDVQFDDVDGYVDCNWCQIDYPSSKGGTVAKKTINPAEVAALIHYDMVTDPRNGYSQSPRWGGDHPDGMKRLDIGGHSYEYALGSYDCSSSVITAWRQALRYTRHEGELDEATYTADMRAPFVASGLFAAKYSAARRGDLYLAEAKHVAMCQDGGADGVFGYDCLSEFNRNENHAATGGRVGDQDGQEAVLRAYYDDGWNTVLHYVGGLLEDVTVESRGDEGDNMTVVTKGFFVTIDGSKTEHFSEDGVHLHAIANTDEKRAIIKWWKEMLGIDLDATPKRFGAADSPWGARYNDVMSRDAQFEGFERFAKHPSRRTVAREEAGRAADKVINAVDSMVAAGS